MFGIGRLFKAMGLAVSGIFTGWRKKINKNPLIVQATFEDAADKKESDRQKLRSGLSEKMRLTENKKKEVVTLKSKLNGDKGLKKVLAGIELMIKQRGESLRQQNGGNLTADIVAKDPQLVGLRLKHEEKKREINNTEQRIVKLESETATSEVEIARHEGNLAVLRDQAKNLREEGAGRVADLISNKAERDLNDQLSGYSTTSDDRQLKEIRELCESDGIETNISRRMAEADGSTSDDIFLKAADAQGASADFDALLGITEKTKLVPVPNVPEKLPE